MYKRPNLFTSYEAESQILPTWTQKVLMAFFVLQLFLLPFSIPFFNDDIPGLSWLPFIGDGIPLFRFLGDGEWIRTTTFVLMLLIAALGLNLLSGVAGQVSLGHAFFMGVGACTATYLGSASGDTTWGHSLPIWIWLPAAGTGLWPARITVRKISASGMPSDQCSGFSCTRTQGWTMRNRKGRSPLAQCSASSGVGRCS